MTGPPALTRAPLLPTRSAISPGRRPWDISAPRPFKAGPSAYRSMALFLQQFYFSMPSMYPVYDGQDVYAPAQRARIDHKVIISLPERYLADQQHPAQYIDQAKIKLPAPVHISMYRQLVMYGIRIYLYIPADVDQVAVRKISGRQRLMKTFRTGRIRTSREDHRLPYRKVDSITADRFARAAGSTDNLLNSLCLPVIKGNQASQQQKSI